MDGDPNGSGHERPWTEREWEVFIAQSDARATKYGELLETLGDRPDHEVLIAREMGWDQEADGVSPAGPWGEGGLEVPEITPEDERELREALEEEERQLHGLPVYVKSVEWGRRVHELVRPLLDGPGKRGEAEAQKASVNGRMAALRIAGGHGMGTDEDALCGNIVMCRKALAAVNKSLHALRELVQQKLLTSADSAPALAEGEEIAVLLEDRVADLRKRVWWDGPK